MLYILKSNPKLEKLSRIIKGVTIPTFKRVTKLLNLNTQIDIIVQQYKSWSDDFTVSGYTTDMPNPTTLFITIDPTRKRMSRVIRQQLPVTLAHELHHLRRMQGPGYGTTPRETIVSEALAARFEDEMFGGGTPFYCKGTKAQVQKLWKEWEPRLDKPCLYEYWFEGKSKTLPPSVRYILGYALTHNLPKKPSELVMTPAKEIRIGL